MCCLWPEGSDLPWGPVRDSLGWSIRDSCQRSGEKTCPSLDERGPGVSSVRLFPCTWVSLFLLPYYASLSCQKDRQPDKEGAARSWET